MSFKYTEMIQNDQNEKLDVLVSQSVVIGDEENNMGFEKIGTENENQEKRFHVCCSRKIFVFCFMIFSVLLVSLLGIFIKYHLMNLDDWEYYGNEDSIMRSGTNSNGSNTSSPNTFKSIIKHSGKKSGGELLSYFKNNIDIIRDHFYDDDQEDKSNNTLWVSNYYDLFNKFIREIQKQEKEGQSKSKKSKIEILTKNVQVLNNAHSHNDYWRKLPVYEAMLYGIKSIEADIWTIENLDIGYDDCIELSSFSSSTSSICDILAVGHDVQSLRPLEKNLENLYLDPMVDYLDELNGNSDSFVEGKPLKGLFHKAPEETMTLFIDFKQERTNRHTYDILISKYLNKEKYRKYLSYIDSKTNTLVIKPITIILTGAYPVLENSEYEDYIFLDLEIVDLVSTTTTTTTTTSEMELPPAFTISTSLSKLWNHCYRLGNETMIDDNHDDNNDEISKNRKVPKMKNYYKYIYFVRTYLGKNPIKDSELQCMKQEIAKIHKLPLYYKTTNGPTHLKTRIWDIPGSPIKKRNYYWKKLWKVVNFDYISVDNLGDFAHFVSIEK